MRSVTLTSAEQLDPSGSMHLLDPSSATPAAISRTWFIALLIRAVHKFVPSKREEADDEENPFAVGIDDISDSPGSGTVTPNGTTKSEEILQPARAAAVKAGGRRRKAPRKG